MASNKYRVVSNWRVTGRLDEVAAILGDPESWQRWWPAAFLRVTEGSPQCAGGVGRWVSVHSKGWLPYTLRLRARVARCRYPFGCRLAVEGDFVGRCDCSLEQRGHDVVLVFDWQVQVHKPVVRRLSWLLKPAFVANHKWVMRQGQRSLDIEVRRRGSLRRGMRPPDESPPQPTFPYGARYAWLRNAAARIAQLFQRLAPIGRRSPQLP